MRRFISILFLTAAALGFAAHARADDLNAADADNVRGVIAAQLAAFEADDASRAFSFATPQLQKVFGSADNFLLMVRSSYPVVYHGLAPDTFTDEAEVVVEGRIQRDGTFRATTLLAKCGSRYATAPKQQSA